MNLKNDNGFTLIEILIAITLLVILAAAGLKVYSGIFGKADTGAIINNVNQLETVANEYVMSNGGSFVGISATTMKTYGDLPSNWLLDSNGGITPPNSSIVSEYYVTQHVNGITGDSFDIGFIGPQLTDNEVKSVCKAFLNKIIAFGWNGTAYPVSATAPTATSSSTPSSNSCSAITSNNTPITGAFYLGFE